VPITVGVGLEEDGARSVFRGVGGNGKWSREVGHVEDGFREEQRFQSIESVLTVWGPFPREVFFGEVNEESCDIGVVGNETAIEVGKAKESEMTNYSLRVLVVK
jgi:hypothetical protein